MELIPDDEYAYIAHMHRNTRKRKGIGVCELRGVK